MCLQFWSKKVLLKCKFVRDVKRNQKKGQLIKKIDLETGEVKETFRMVDRVFSSRGYIPRMNASFVKIHYFKELPSECNLLDCGRFYKLLEYIVGDNQLLGVRTSKGFKPLDIEKMSNIFSGSERSVKTFLKKFKELKIIKETNVGDVVWYGINPLYALKGKYISQSAFMMFQDELANEIPEWAVNGYLGINK